MSVRRFAAKKLEDSKSLASSFVTDPTEIKYLDNVGYIISCSSVTANTGIFTPQGQIGDSAWFDLELDIPAQLANSDTTFEISLNQVPYERIRLSFADSAGDGVCTIHVSCKAIGG